LDGYVYIFGYLFVVIDDDSKPPDELKLDVLKSKIET
jgi:hypothetical protein